MRTRIWNNLANIKFKALYTDACDKWASAAGRSYSFTLAFASATSVATWALWQQYPVLWAFIVGAAQVLHLAKPYVPYVGNEKDYLAMSFEFEGLYLEYERLWYDFENVKLKEPEVERRFYALREKEISIEKTHKNARCPSFEFLMRRAQQETDNVLALNFAQGAHNERPEAATATTAAETAAA